MIPFQIDPSWYQAFWAARSMRGESSPRRREDATAVEATSAAACERSRVGRRGLWLAALLFIAVAAAEAAIVLEAGVPVLALGDYDIVP